MSIGKAGASPGLRQSKEALLWRLAWRLHPHCITDIVHYGLLLAKFLKLSCLARKLSVR